MDVNRKPHNSFYLALVAGAFILLGTLISASVSIGEYEVVGPASVIVGIIGAVLGLAFGALVLYAAIMLNSKPAQHTRWGMVILVSSFLSLFTSWGGLGLGMLAGLISG
ncbi:MAG: DUF6114 domain-containing protein, partial [Chloroflexi bacterium]|nr:DUF6114 domain-containing protein [Chloroflexota bacterium]